MFTGDRAPGPETRYSGGPADSTVQLCEIALDGAAADLKWGQAGRGPDWPD